MSVSAESLRLEINSFEKRLDSGDHRMSPEDCAEDGNAEAIQIVSFSNGRVEFDRKALSKLIHKEELQNRYAIVLSVAGAFRKGKSFLLNFVLKYLYHNYDIDSPVEAKLTDWMGPQDQPLKGFSWRGGSERNTTGILIWSKVFLVTLPDQEKGAILIMDTQGTFDSGSTVKESATIFALSTLLSSIQIYNLGQNIQEDDLHNLQLFIDYGKLAMADHGSKPFQKLLFLIRDWCYPYEADYGASGGQEFLQKRLSCTANQNPELQSTRRCIKAYFSKLACFLMPHPGERVTTDPNFNGKLSEISEKFLTHLRHLILMLLTPENLLIKEIGGQKVKAGELINYFDSYIALFDGDSLPEPKSVLAASAEANNLTAVAVAKDLYSELMDDCCGNSKPHMSEKVLVFEHMKNKSKSLMHFTQVPKIGGEEISDKYKKTLDLDLELMFDRYKQFNQLKGTSIYTPSVFLGIITVFYFLSGVFGFVAFYNLANLCNILMGISILVLLFYSYGKYCGEYQEFVEALDYMSFNSWEHFGKPLLFTVLRKLVSQAVSLKVHHVKSE